MMKYSYLNVLIMAMNLIWKPHFLLRWNQISAGERAADNPILPMKEVYSQDMSSDATPLEDDLLEPQLRACKSQMYRVRRKNMPPLSATREDINLEGQWALTKEDQQFLLHQDDDMVLFATDNNQEMMADAIFMDGTFKISPLQFTQLFIFMGFFIPCSCLRTP